MKATKKAFALLHLPHKDAMRLPGFGWRPPDEGTIKSQRTELLVWRIAGGGGAGGVARSSSALLGA